MKGLLEHLGLSLRLHFRNRMALLYGYLFPLIFLAAFWVLYRHEKIHFWQQVEMLFIFHWFFYSLFYLVARAKGHCHYIAYRYNPFEIEAFNNEANVKYLKVRKPFAWVRYVNDYRKVLPKDMKATVPQEKFISLQAIHRLLR